MGETPGLPPQRTKTGMGPALWLILGGVALLAVLCCGGGAIALSRRARQPG
jgi:hypothetical protein